MIYTYKHHDTKEVVICDTVEQRVAHERRILENNEDLAWLSLRNGTEPVPGTRNFCKIVLRPGAMAKVAFESEDSSMGWKLRLAGAVMMYPDAEYFDLDGNLFIRCDGQYWLIVGEQTGIGMDEEDPVSFSRHINL